MTDKDKAIEELAEYFYNKPPISTLSWSEAQIYASRVVNAGYRKSENMGDNAHLALEVQRVAMEIFRVIENLAPVCAIMSDSGMAGFPIIADLTETTSYKSLKSKYTKAEAEEYTRPDNQGD